MASQSAAVEIARIYTQGQKYASWTTAKSMLGSATATAASSGIQPVWGGAFVLGSTISIDFEASIGWASGNTMTFSVMLGSAAVFTSDAIKVTTTGGTDVVCYGRIHLTCTAIGNGTLATLRGNGHLIGRMIVPPGATAGADYSAGSGSSVLKATTGNGAGFDSTVQNALDFHLAMGTNSASNTFRLDQYAVMLRGLTGP